MDTNEMKKSKLSKVIRVMVLSSTGNAWLHSILDRNEGKAFRGLIGGSFESLPLSDGLYILVHDEGKLIGLPPNRLACDVTLKLTDPARLRHDALFALSTGNYLVGNCVLYRANAEGRTESLTEADIQRITGPQDNGDEEMSWEGFELSDEPTGNQEFERDGTKSDSELKSELLTLAKSGAPRPLPGTVLGDALIRFTTKPKSRSIKKRK